MSMKCIMRLPGRAIDWILGYRMCAMLPSSGLLSWTHFGTSSACAEEPSRSFSVVHVRPGPWNPNNKYKHLGRVYGDAYIDAKALNESIAKAAQLTMVQLQDCRTKVERDAVSMSFVREIDLITKHGEGDMTFVNVATVVHRIGMVTAAAGSNDVLVSAHKELICRLAKLMYGHLNEFGPRQLSNIFWGLGKLGPGVRRIVIELPIPLDHQPTIDDIVRMLLKKVKIYRKRLRPVNISNVFLGLAYLDYKRCRKFKAGCAPEIKNKLSDFTAQHLSNFAWALSKLHFEDEIGLLSAMDQASRQKIPEFSTRELCGFMQGMAALEYKDCHSLFSECMPVVESRLQLMTSREICTLVWVWAKAMYHPGEFILNAMLNQMCEHLIHGQHGMLSLTMLNAAHLNYTNPRLLVAADRFFLTNIPLGDYKVLDVCNMLWGLTIMNEVKKEHLTNAGQRLRRVVPELLSQTELNQLYQCYVNVRILRKELSGSLGEFLTPAMVQKCKESWIELQEQLVPTHTVRNVGYALKSMGMDMEAQKAPEVPININVAKNTNGRQVVVEIITSSRCAANNRALFSGPYMWRERILEVLNWEIVRVDQKRFEELPLLTDKTAYLESILPPQILKKDATKDKLNVPANC